MAMTFQDSVLISAPRQQVYAFLTDPEKVSQCAPDVQKLEVLDDGRFRVVVRAGVGFVKATFNLDVTWLERTPYEQATARARGSAPGSGVDMTARMRLSEDGATTRLDWQANVTVSGTLASVGARLIQGAASKITGEVFSCVKQKLEAATPRPVGAATPPA